MQNNIRSLFQVSEVELVYHNKVKAADRPKINSIVAAFDLLLSMWDRNKIELVEQSYILLLDRSNHCLGISHLSTGGVSECLIDPKIVFVTALKARASGFILAHNHPSGNLKPSKSDIYLTEKMRQAGKFLDVQMLDHMIVTPRGYYSFAEEGLI